MKQVEFIKRILEVKVDGLRGINTYKIIEAYNEIDHDNFAHYKQKTIDEIDYTWSEIESDGGLSKVLAEIKETYNIAA
jgi:hypothetical protein